MNFEFTQEQTLLRNALHAFLRDQYTFKARRKAVLSEAGWSREVWRTLGRDLGLLGVALPERVGGLDGGAVEIMIAMEELGAVLFVEPFLETCVMAGGVLARAGGAKADAMLARIVTGDAIVACAWGGLDGADALAAPATRATRRDDGGWTLEGTTRVTMAAPWADVVLVAARTAGVDGDEAGLSLFLVEKTAPGIVSHDYPTIDARSAADLAFNRVALPADALVGEAGAAFAVLEEANDRALAAICAQAVGVLKRMLADTIDYALQRKQFGQSIASFQALQHRMVDMYLQTELATSAMLLATLSLDKPPAPRAQAASAAKVTIAKACRFVGQNAVQLHGAMGMTDELPLGHYFKRATVIETEFGGVDTHLARHARLEAAPA